MAVTPISKKDSQRKSEAIAQKKMRDSSLITVGLMVDYSLHGLKKTLNIQC